MSRVMTFEQWYSRGYVVKAGHRHIGRDQFGRPLFHGNQVTRRFKPCVYETVIVRRRRVL